MIRNKMNIFKLLSKTAIGVGLCLLLFVSSLKADEIVVGGALTEDQIWTPDNTYIVDQDLRIGQNIRLVILAGVTVKINQGRGIQLNGGDLIVGDPTGTITDTVRFLGNYRGQDKGWKWKGITIEGVNDENSVKFYYVSIRDAEIGLDIRESYYIVVQNSTIADNQNLGIRITDCRRCWVENCMIVGNYDGIELAATSFSTARYNLILNNRILNINHNIYMRAESSGFLNSNEITHNLIEGANNGIWMDKETNASASGNNIHRNVFVGNGSGFGYGMLLAFDSTLVSDNIFWHNNIAVNCDPLGHGNEADNNSFYQNVRGVQIGAGSGENKILHNTYSQQSYADFDTKEIGGIVFRENNLFPKDFSVPMVYNSSSEDMTIDGIFWHTSNSEEIDQLIWDQKDDPMLGAFYYEPILNQPDTTYPISPPTRVIKQLAEGEVRVSWLQNPEADLAGYRVYFGDFQYYQFANQMDAGMVNSLVLANASIHDSIAVTSYDGSVQSEDAQFLGFESPFSFAEYYPYAGEDQQFCINQSQFSLNSSTAPFSYSTLSWKTTGDGTFSNPAIVNPKYYPGQQDLLNGSVMLSINVLRKGEWLSDSMEVTFLGAASVSAGSDTTIFIDESLQLTEAESQFGGTLLWTTSGDGFFNSDSILHPTYVPGQLDINTGKVSLILMGENVCGVDRDTIQLSIVQRYTLKGTVWNGAHAANPCAIVAFERTSGSDRAIGMQVTDNFGNFTFDHLIPAEYLLYAVPDTSAQKTHYPGYYVDAGRWHECYPLDLHADIYDVDIHLPSLDYQLPEGEGKISGRFIEPTTFFQNRDIFCQPWFEESLADNFCVAGPSNITILLYNSTHEKVLAYTLTDANGNFYFSGLPMGSFVVDAEKAGYTTQPSAVFTLTSDRPVVTDVSLSVEQKSISIQLPDHPHTSGSNPVVFPNPAGHEVHISLNSTDVGVYHVVISNVYGSMLIESDKFVGQNSSFGVITLNVGELSGGVYVGSIVHKGQRWKFKFVVQ